jgi:large subunit ribosomal protein L17
MLANLATSILDKERVTTTVAKAKEVRGVVERLITYSKRGNLHGVRLAARTVRDKTVLKKLFDEIGPGYQDRQGGYLRIVKAGHRDGDNASMCVVELVGRGSEDIQRKRKRKSKKKKSSQRKTPRPAAKAEKTKPAEEASAETAGAEETKTAEAETKPSTEEKAESDAAAGGETAGKNDEEADTKGDSKSEKDESDKK